MTDSRPGDYEQRTISYPHPADIDAEPEAVGPLALDDLDAATSSYAMHVNAAVRQVRNSWQTRRLAEEGQLSAADLAAEWESSDEAKLAALLTRAAAQALRAVRGLQDRV